MVNQNGRQILYSSRAKAADEIAAGMNAYCDGLLVIDQIGRKEWLDAFIGGTNIGQTFHELDDQLRKVEAMRHSLGSPFMSIDRAGFSTTVGVIARPQNYSPYHTDSFFRYKLEKYQEGGRWLGSVGCRAFYSVNDGQTNNLRDDFLTLLTVERPFYQTSPDAISMRLFDDKQVGDESDEPPTGIVVGLHAISLIAASRLSDHPNLWPRRHADEQLRRIYEYAGEAVMTPKTDAAY